MKRSVRLAGLVIFLSLILTGAVVFATGGTSTVTTKQGTTVGAPQPPGKCCIMGKYEGIHKDLPSKTCPKPEEGKFIMEINQDKSCGSKIWGKVIDPKDDSSNDFTGTVTPGEKGCCNIQGGWRRPGVAAAPGKAAEPPEDTKFKGLLCKKGGKWAGKGNYTTTRGPIICNGTWEMKQM